MKRSKLLDLIGTHSQANTLKIAKMRTPVTCWEQQV